MHFIRTLILCLAGDLPTGNVGKTLECVICAPHIPQSLWFLGLRKSTTSGLFSRNPLFGGPRDNHAHDLRDQEQHDGAAEVFAHGFHVS